MQSFAFDDIVRYTLIISIVALVSLCLTFSIIVWIRRNKVRVRVSSGIVFGLVTIAGLATIVTATRYAMTSYKGIVEAHDVFTVRSRGDAAATVIATGGTVGQGEPLVRFQSPGLQNRLAGLDSRIMAVREQLQSSDLQPLLASAAIVERKRHIAEQLAQSQSILIDLQKSSRENHRALLETQSQTSERLGQLDMQIDANTQVSTFAASQLAITQNAFDRAQYLQAHGIENVGTSEGRLADRLSKELTLKRAASDSAAMDRMKTEMLAMSASSLAFLSSMQSRLEAQIEGQETTIAGLRRDLVDAEHAEELDLQRAAEARRHDRDAMVYQIGGIEAEKNALVAATTTDAPFAGTVIYSNSAPDIASNNSLLLALAPASGFAARPDGQRCRSVPGT